GVERVSRDVELPQLRLLHTLVQRGPVHHLEVDDEPELFELLLRHERRFVHELVFLRADPTHGLARVAGFLHQTARLVLVSLVVTPPRRRESGRAAPRRTGPAGADRSPCDRTRPPESAPCRAPPAPPGGGACSSSGPLCGSPRRAPSLAASRCAAR